MSKTWYVLCILIYFFYFSLQSIILPAHVTGIVVALAPAICNVNTMLRDKFDQRVVHLFSSMTLHVQKFEKNLSTGPEGKTYRNIKVNWSVCIEKYLLAFNSFITNSWIFNPIIEINSSLMVLDRYETCLFPLFAYFLMCSFKNGSNLASNSNKAQVITIWRRTYLFVCTSKC